MTGVSQELFSNWLISIIEVVGPRLNSSATLNDRKAGAQTARVDQWHEREEFLATVAFGGIETIDLRCPGKTPWISHARHSGQLPRERVVLYRRRAGNRLSLPSRGWAHLPECILRI